MVRRGSTASTIADLRERASGCVRCPLARSRTQVVFGSGNPDARLMIIGEAPGGAEDAHGQPFLGTAGKLLESLLAEIALRREDVYLANVVMCRPLTDRQPASDRRPRALEIAACASYLDEQIRLVRPRVIVALGATATQRLIGRRTTVTSARRNEHMVGGARLVPTFHPSPLSINRTAGRRAVLTADFRLARELLGTT